MATIALNYFQSSFSYTAESRFKKALNFLRTFNYFRMHIVLIGNKIDLKEERCVSYEDGLNLANEWKNAGTIVSFIEVSAATGEVRSNFEEKKKIKKKKSFII